jgi:hypothetical protein
MNKNLTISDISSKKCQKHVISTDELGSNLFSFYNKIANITKNELGSFRLMFCSSDLLLASHKTFQDLLVTFRFNGYMEPILVLVPIKSEDRFDYTQKLNYYPLVRNLMPVTDKEYFITFFKNGSCTF